MESVKFYKNVNSRFKNTLPEPLVEINPNELNDLNINDMFITSHGTRLKKVADNEYEIDKPSDLVDGELVENLTPLQLKAFWNIMNYIG